MDIVIDRLKHYDFDIEWLNFGETKNIWLRHGKNPPLFAFLGHTDVVPPGPADKWRSDPFDAIVSSGFLYGRGAADMKSSVAAMVEACCDFLDKTPNHHGSLAILLTSDEEALASDGVVKVVEVLEGRNEKIDWCLVGEPSSEKTLGDTVKIGRRGSLSGTLQIAGSQGHVAYPHLAKNPIHLFAPASVALTQEVWDQGNEFFPATSLQISNINAGTGAENVIPDHIDVEFNLRFSTELNDQTIKKRVHEILDGYGLDYQLKWRLSGKPFFTKSKQLINAVAAAVTDVTGISPELSTAGGTSDGRFIAPTGAEVVEFGPLNLTIHKVNECVALDDIDKLTLIYQKVLETLLLERVSHFNVG